MVELVYGIAKSGKVASEINEGQFNMAPLGVSQYDGLETSYKMHDMFLYCNVCFSVLHYQCYV